MVDANERISVLAGVINQTIWLFLAKGTLFFLPGLWFTIVGSPTMLIDFVLLRTIAIVICILQVLPDDAREASGISSLSRSFLHTSLNSWPVTILVL